MPTFAFTLEGWHPRAVAEKMAAQNINLWDGKSYAISITERLGVEESGGMVRVGPVQTNTLEEVGRLREALRGLVGEIFHLWVMEHQWFWSAENRARVFHKLAR